MATLKAEQVERKKLQQNDRLVDAGITELSDNDLEDVAGGATYHQPGVMPKINPVL